MTKHEALKKYAHLTNSALGYYGNEEKAIKALAAMDLTKAEVLAFWNDVKDFSWPGSFGVSPWEFFGHFAYYMATDRIDDGTLTERAIWKVLRKLRGESDA